MHCTRESTCTYHYSRTSLASYNRTDTRATWNILRSSWKRCCLAYAKLNLLSTRHVFVLLQIVLSSDTFSSAREWQQSDTVNQHQLNILELNVSKFLVTNVRTESTSSRSRLEQHLDLFKATKFFENVTSRPMSTLFTKHSYETYLYANPLSSKTSQLSEPPSTSRALHTYYTMTTDSLKKAWITCTPATSGSI